MSVSFFMLSPINREYPLSVALESDNSVVEVDDEPLVQLLLPTFQQVQVSQPLGEPMTRHGVYSHDIGVSLTPDVVFVEPILVSTRPSAQLAFLGHIYHPLRYAGHNYPGQRISPCLEQLFLQFYWSVNSPFIKCSVAIMRIGKYFSYQKWAVAGLVFNHPKGLHPIHYYAVWPTKMVLGAHGRRHHTISSAHHT